MAKCFFVVLLNIVILISGCRGDFFSDLDQIGDVDAQLLEIDKMFEKIDANEDEALQQISGKKEKADPLDGLASSLGDLLSGDCSFSCPNGAVPKTKKGHMPTSNGCGSYGLKLDLEELPEMTACCDVHDKCYDTCNSNRDRCDTDFKKCLQKMCKGLKSALTKEEYAGCKSTADVIHTGAVALGCKAYKSAQTNACTCGEEADKILSKNEGNKKQSNKSSPPKGNKEQHKERVQQKKKEKAEQEKKEQEAKKKQNTRKENNSKTMNKKMKKNVKDEL